MTVSIFAGVDTGTVVMIVLAVIIGVYLHVLERKQKKGDTDVCARYARLTEEHLAALDDEELVRAVAANLTAKQDRQHPDLSLVLPLLSPGRCGVYSVWLVVNELARRELKGYFRSPYRRFAAFAAEGFSLIGATVCAEAMTAACKRYEREKNGEKELPSWEMLTDELRQAITAEQPLARCAAYIRDNTAEFVDR